MGPPSYMQSVIDHNVVMQRIPVIYNWSVPNMQETSIIVWSPLF